jgi:hypothetical protein
MAGWQALGVVDAVVILLMAAVLVLFLYRRYGGEVEYVKSRVDGRTYLTQKLADSQGAADRLARLNANFQALIRHMVAKFPESQDVQRLYHNFSPDSLSEGGREHGFTSYSVNKGEKIVMCLRQPDATFVPDNVVLYVGIHELGHLMTEDVGHTESFWANFRILLEEAMSIGMYKHQDFSKDPQPYCGITIKSSVV